MSFFFFFILEGHRAEATKGKKRKYLFYFYQTRAKVIWFSKDVFVALVIEIIISEVIWVLQGYFHGLVTISFDLLEVIVVLRMV